VCDHPSPTPHTQLATLHVQGGEGRRRRSFASFPPNTFPPLVRSVSDELSSSSPSSLLTRLAVFVKAMTIFCVRWVCAVKHQIWHLRLAMLTGARPFSGPPLPFCLPLPVMATRSKIFSIGADWIHSRGLAPPPPPSGGPRAPPALPRSPNGTNRGSKQLNSDDLAKK
jgi:hypothetical protein